MSESPFWAAFLTYAMVGCVVLMAVGARLMFPSTRAPRTPAPPAPPLRPHLPTHAAPAH